ncbi:MAG: alpha/beta hydrolase [Planctomycetaceae bacterium]|jgi:acetyl esterase/lipase|nr:alpha/beta hydrolase [bacterium]MDG2391774.1 alpha/beta hydrolase [Planctomycetaceae bacterium]
MTRLLLLAVLVLNSITAESFAVETTVRRDIEYATVDDHRLLLDLYLPDREGPHPVIVWVHGGAWRAGSKKSMPLDELVNIGYAIASIDYRLSPVAPFPAQVHDIKAAIRFLRAHTDEYGLNTKNIAIAGSSAGGHLAALVGVTNGNEYHEGKVGQHLDQSSDVAAIIDMYGPTNFLTILNQSTPHGLGVRIPALQLLLRKQPTDDPVLAKLASPVYHIDAADPPLLVIHGVQDPQVPISQSLELHGVYKNKGRSVHLHMIYDGVHGGPSFTDPARIKLMDKFLSPILFTTEQ